MPLITLSDIAGNFYSGALSMIILTKQRPPQAGVGGGTLDIFFIFQYYFVIDCQFHIKVKVILGENKMSVLSYKRYFVQSSIKSVNY